MANYLKRQRRRVTRVFDIKQAIATIEAPAELRGGARGWAVKGDARMKAA